MFPLFISNIKDTGSFSKSRAMLFISLPLLFIVQLLVFQIKIGVILIAGLGLLLIGLLKPVILYMLVIASFSIEGFTAVPGVSFAKIGGILLSIVLLLRIALRKETIPKDDSYKYFFIFFLGGLASFAAAEDIPLSIQFYVTYISLVILYMVIRYFIKTEKDVYIALNVIFVATIASLVYLFIMKGGQMFALHGGVPRFTGGIGDSNEYASYILVLLPLAVYRAMNSVGRLKVLYIAYGFIFFIILMYTGSRGGLLGFLGAFVVFIRHFGISKLKLLFVALLLLSVSLYLFLPEGYIERAATIASYEKKEDSRDTRIDNYRIAWKMFLDRPLAGFGMNHFKLSSLKYGAVHSMVVHNTYLEILVGGGLLTFIPFLLILINSWNRLKIKNIYEKNIHDLMVCLKASFVSILITSFFLTAGHAKILWFLLALISSVYYIAQSQNDNMISERTELR